MRKDLRGLWSISQVLQRDASAQAVACLFSLSELRGVVFTSRAAEEKHG